ncbi:MAG: hypothetical protein HY554_11120 [Elusimicrobia bacterium]|nr:hypothetical protein [Elusimicrobiota bacterium]
MSRAVEFFRASQEAKGSWTAPIRTSSARYNTYLILLYEALGLAGEKRELIAALMRYIWSQQTGLGGFAGYPGGKEESSLALQVYLAAKIAGEDERSERMRRLETFIRERDLARRPGRAKPFLMLFNLAPPPLMAPGLFRAVLALEGKLPWVRVLVYPLLYLLASRHSIELAPEKVPHRIGLRSLPRSKGSRVWGAERFFRWLLERFNRDGTFFDYTPTSVFALIALSTRLAHRGLVARGLETLEGFVTRVASGAAYLSPGYLDLGETLVVLLALLDAGVSPDDPMVRRAEALLWRSRHPKTGAFGASFHNDHFPDADTTASAIYALRRLAQARGERRPDPRLRQGIDWLLTRQNADGGFATYEKASLPWLSGWLKRLLGKKEIVLSESVIEHTARAVGTLSLFQDESPRIRAAFERGHEWLLRRQQADGSYPGTWMIDYLFGTAMAVPALGTRGDDPRSRAALERAFAFLERHQRADGGFSESPDSYAKGEVVTLPYGSPAQTGAILVPLLLFLRETGYRDWTRLEPMLSRAAGFLRGAQQEDGLWRDATWTATTFPGYEYVIYPFIQEAAPLHAVALYEQALAVLLAASPAFAQPRGAGPGAPVVPAAFAEPMGPR